MSRLSVVLVTVAVAALANAVSAMTLENGALRLEFCEADGGFGLKGIVNRLAGDVRFGAPAGGRDLWEIRLARRGVTTNEYCTVANRSPAVSREAKRTADGVRFFWKGVDLPDDFNTKELFRRVDAGDHDDPVLR